MHLPDFRVFWSRRLQAWLLTACGLAVCGDVAAQTLRDAGGIARLEFSVHTISPTEFPKDTSGEWMQFFSPGVASGALGLAAPPMYASGLIVGGLLLAPGALIISDREHRIWQRAANALKATRFERDLLRAVQTRANRMPLIQPPVPDPGATASVELVVNAYGLAGTQPERVCFIASVDLVVQAGGRQMLRDRLTISPAERSADAPPAQCASLERMAEGEGQLIRDTAAEYAEVLAIMAVDRIAMAIKR